MRSEMMKRTVGALDKEYMGEWGRFGSITLEGSLHQVSEETSGRCGNILWEILHKTRSITSISNDVVCRVLHQSKYT